jgi:UDP-N-acetyl-D-mannosaminuronate dehydrogenase
LPKQKVAIYGLTSEGYSIASRLVEKSSVTIVDETLQIAMDLEQSVVKTHRTLQDLAADEMLMGLRPISSVLSEAPVIMFTPKLRKTGDEAVIEASSKLRDVAKYVSAGSTVVNFLPTGIGGNSDNVALLEKHTGMKVGERLNYAYSPIFPETGIGKGPGSSEDAPVKAAVFGEKGASEGFASLDELGFRSEYGAIANLELEYITRILSLCTSMAAEVELMRKSREQKASLVVEPERYVDQLASLVYDLTAIQSSEDVGEPITYLAGAAVKSLENYERYIVEETRDLLRELQLKASRTRVMVAWSADKYEMRADRRATAHAVTEKLRDYVTDVRQVDSTSRTDELIDSYKHSVAIVCTPADFEWFKGLKKSFRSSEITIVKATTGMTKA